MAGLPLPPESPMPDERSARDAMHKTATDNARRTLEHALERGSYARICAEANRLLPDEHPDKITLAMVDDLSSLLHACAEAGLHPQPTVTALCAVLSRRLYPDVDE